MPVDVHFHWHFSIFEKPMSPNANSIAKWLILSYVNCALNKAFQLYFFVQEDVIKFSRYPLELSNALAHGLAFMGIGHVIPGLWDMTLARDMSLLCSVARNEFSGKKILLHTLADAWFELSGGLYYSNFFITRSNNIKNNCILKIY